MQSKYPLTKLSPSADRTLFLIRAELKTQKLFNILNDAGMCDSFYQAHLDKLILQYFDMDDGEDHTVDFFVKLIDKRSRKIKADNNSLMKQSMKVYMELLAEKERRKRAE